MLRHRSARTLVTLMSAVMLVDLPAAFLIPSDARGEGWADSLMGQAVVSANEEEWVVNDDGSTENYGDNVGTCAYALAISHPRDVEFDGCDDERVAGVGAWWSHPRDRFPRC